MLEIRFTLTEVVVWTVLCNRISNLGFVGPFILIFNQEFSFRENFNIFFHANFIFSPELSSALLSQIHPLKM